MGKIAILLLFWGGTVTSSQCNGDAYTFKAAHDGDFTSAYMYQRLNACRKVENTVPLVDQELSALIVLGEGTYASEDERFNDAFRLTIAAAIKGSETAMNTLIGEFRYGERIGNIQVVEKNVQVADCIEHVRDQKEKTGDEVKNCLPPRYLDNR